MPSLLFACVCPLGAWTQNFLEDPREHQASVEMLSTPDLDKIARMIADATGAEGMWEGPGGAGGEPGALGDSSEAVLRDHAHGGVGVRGECPCLPLTLVVGKAQDTEWWTPDFPRASAEQPFWEANCPRRVEGWGCGVPLLRCRVRSSLLVWKCFCLDWVLVNKSNV